MDQYEVPCIDGRIKQKYMEEPVFVSVPGSKSITNRALLISALAEGDSTLNRAMLSGDSRVFIECLKALGVSIDVSDPLVGDLAGNVNIKVRGCKGYLPPCADLNVGSAGTAARFLTALLGVSHGTYRLDSSPQMRKRPMQPLLDTLTKLGCEVTCHKEPGHFPFTLNSDGVKKHEINVDINESSQFLSAMLIVSVLAGKNLYIDVMGTHGMDYVDMTVAMMKEFGVKVNLGFRIAGHQSYTGRDYDIEADASAAAYFYALSPLLGLKIGVRGIHSDSLQGDVKFIHALELMGCSSYETDEGIVLCPPADGVIHGIGVDMSSYSDQAITLSCIAAFADSPTTITGIGHIRKQESDRLSGIASELGKMGIETDMTEDGITIKPGIPKPAVIETYDDHRMAMAFTLIGLKNPGIVINNPGCCAKTFENYYPVLEDLIKTVSD